MARHGYWYNGSEERLSGTWISTLPKSAGSFYTGSKERLSGMWIPNAPTATIAPTSLTAAKILKAAPVKTLAPVNSPRQDPKYVSPYLGSKERLSGESLPTPTKAAVAAQVSVDENVRTVAARVEKQEVAAGKAPATAPLTKPVLGAVPVVAVPTPGERINAAAAAKATSTATAPPSPPRLGRPLKKINRRQERGYGKDVVVPVSVQQQAGRARGAIFGAAAKKLRSVG